MLGIAAQRQHSRAGRHHLPLCRCFFSMQARGPWFPARHPPRCLLTWPCGVSGRPISSNHDHPQGGRWVGGCFFVHTLWPLGDRILDRCRGVLLSQAGQCLLSRFPSPGGGCVSDTSRGEASAWKVCELLDSATDGLECSGPFFPRPRLISPLCSGKEQRAGSPQFRKHQSVSWSQQWPGLGGSILGRLPGGHGWS